MRIRIYQSWVHAGCRQPQALCSSRGCDESVGFLRMGPHWRPLALQCRKVHPPSPVVIGITQVSHSGCMGVAPLDVILEMADHLWLTRFVFLSGWLKISAQYPLELHL